MKKITLVRLDQGRRRRTEISNGQIVRIIISPTICNKSRKWWNGIAPYEVASVINGTMGGGIK